MLTFEATRPTPGARATPDSNACVRFLSVFSTLMCIEDGAGPIP